MHQFQLKLQVAAAIKLTRPADGLGSKIRSIGRVEVRDM